MEDKEISESIRVFEELSLTDGDSNLSELHRDSDIVKLVLRAMNGNRRALHDIEARARGSGKPLLFHVITVLTRSTPSLSLGHRHNLQEALNALLPLLGQDFIRAHTRTIIDAITPLLASSDSTDNEIARNIVSSLTGSVGLDFMTDLINPDIFTCNEQHNSRAVQVLTAVASSVGTAALVPFLESVCSIMNPGSARDAGYRTVRQIVMVNKDSVVPHMTPLVNIALKEIAAGSNTWSVASAARAIDSLARAAHSYGVNDNFSKAMPVIFHCMRNHFNRRWTKSAVACAQAIGSIIGLTEEPAKSFYAKELMETVCRENFGSESLDEETTRVVMAVYKQCLGAKEVTGLDVMGWFNNEGCVFKSLWEGAGS